MKKITYTIKEEVGLHTRPAGELVKTASLFSSSITVLFGEKKADAKRIFNVMSLGAKCGDYIEIEISGDDEDVAFEALEKFVNEFL